MPSVTRQAQPGPRLATASCSSSGDTCTESPVGLLHRKCDNFWRADATLVCANTCTNELDGWKRTTPFKHRQCWKPLQQRHIGKATLPVVKAHDIESVGDVQSRSLCSSHLRKAQPELNAEARHLALSAPAISSVVQLVSCPRAGRTPRSRRRRSLRDGVEGNVRILDFGAGVAQRCPARSQSHFELPT